MEIADIRRSTGSSPRTWGTHAPDRQRGPRPRFIPTHVGNAKRAPRRRATFTVHPHARGERQDGAKRSKIEVGSSPRTWGTRSAHSLTSSDIRFIPTHVGNASKTHTRSWISSVHPHARGERSVISIRCFLRGGSSPRTWGTLYLPPRGVVYGRFIPTHVGNADSILSAYPLGSVHPHARGERARSVVQVSQDAGSSPRTWGTHCPSKRMRPNMRFIPTHVGNAPYPARTRKAPAVHPHARGERVNHCFPVCYYYGSSPRTWGTPGTSATTPPVSRFIPTHVGNALAH